MSETQPPQPVELSRLEIEQLRAASGWARFLAIAGFIVTGLLVLACVAIIVGARSGRVVIGVQKTLFPAVISLGGTSAAAVLLWGYGREVLAFLGRGEPTLTQAFRKLRLFFKLWTIYVVLSTVMDVAAIFGTP